MSSIEAWSVSVERQIQYVSSRKGVDALIDAVVSRVGEGDVPSVVVASTKGKTALRIGEALKGAADVVSVTEFTYSDDVKKSMKKMKIKAIEKADLPIQDRREMRGALEIFGTGVKAALEVTSIAAMCGMEADKIVAVAGGRGGLDTALVARPSKPEDFFSPDPEKRMAVLEVLALPSKF